MKTRTALTPKQNQVLKFIQQRIETQIPPTIREIAKELGFSSTGTVRDYLKILQKKGYLRRASYKSRAIELLKNTSLKVPIIATIPAGGPDFAFEDIQGYIEAGDLFPEKDVFALRVRGDSMIEAGIMPGDIAVIRKQAVAANGEIIAALLENNEVTLKKLRQRNSQTYLEAANKNYPPIHKDFTIMGKLITIIRKY
ncbi:MAG: transcriptional repressor LexA [Candidatus Omnitrophica bacterium]|nr:transcriptional repressor LexA [Candidatus Omnitrophota bacterium]